MRADDDDAVAARLSALGMAPSRGWVPDQSAHLVAPVAAPAPKRVRADAAAPAVPAGAAAPVPRSMAARLDEIAMAADGRAVLWLAAVCALCVVVTAWTLLHHRAAPVPEAPLRVAPPAAQVQPTPSVAGLVVDVGGRVRRPGLVTLPPGARVADAIRAAGGAVRPRDLRQVNLAARVADGQLLLIGVPGASTADASGGSDAPVNLNSATVDQLDALPGIGPVLAQRIIDWRTANGGFRAVADLDQVSGIGDAIYAELSPLVTV